MLKEVLTVTEGNVHLTLEQIIIFLTPMERNVGYVIGRGRRPGYSSKGEGLCY